MDQRTYLDSIIDLMWFYYDMAIQKNQPFLEGTFVLQDQGGRIFNFLFNYVQMVNPDALTATPSLKNPTIQFAYPRISTHFRDEQEKYRQYGIDIRFGKPGTKFTTASIGSAQSLLPTQKSHLIFGQLSDGLIYIKMEVHGTCPDQFVEHGKDYIGSLVRKIKPSLMPYLNKYAPTRVNNLVEYYIETDDEPYYRKEHVPQAVLAHAFEILQRANLPAEQMQTIVLEFAQQGIHGIFTEINKPASPIPQAQKNELHRYLTDLQVNEGLDHQDIRRGREVIITNPDLTVHCLKAMRL